MTAFYNEIDRFCCDWLSNLMDAELITPGKIDDRSIVDIRPSDLAGFERVHFFAGIGGWDYSLGLAGWTGPVWTGSCPCQPFSLAGAQKGFDDSRHLWPEFRRLIAECGPAVVFGEQVASASEWLRLVRGDLEALGYAVGAIPIQAASAGADHLRDRYWFVADANDAGSQGRRVLPECASERSAGPDGMADTDRDRVRHEPRRRGGASGSEEGHSDDRQSSDVAHTYGQRQQTGERCGGERDRSAGSARYGESVESAGRVDLADREILTDARQRLREERQEHDHADTQWSDGGSEFSWVIGADGKARRVKPGIRLLAHGIPNRVGLLRGFGNAIDPRPASEFIGAFMTTLSQQQGGGE